MVALTFSWLNCKLSLIRRIRTRVVQRSFSFLFWLTFLERLIAMHFKYLNTLIGRSGKDYLVL